MAVYLISYDLIAPGRHYPQVHAAIKGINPLDWKKPLESVWFVKTNLHVDAVKETVLKAMDSNDKLLVIEVTRNASAYKLPDDVWKWMGLNL